MHPDILSSQQRALLPLLKESRGQFGLVGGTAIALHLGHRRSIDFDLFSNSSFDIQSLRSKIKQKSTITHTFIQGQDELSVLVDGVKVTFYRFPYHIPFSQEFQKSIVLPDLLTLAAMKAFTLGKRSKWKDYVDLYFLFQQFSWQEIVQKAEEIFGTEFNEKLFRVQLSYFDDIDYSEEVEYLPGFAVDDVTIKQFLQELSVE